METFKNNKVYVIVINYDLFQYGHSYHATVSDLDPLYRERYVLTATTLKAKFRKLRLALMKAYENFQKSEKGVDELEKEKDNDSDGNNVADDKEKEIYSSHFIEFCKGDICVFCMYCCSIKYALLKSALVKMPDESKKASMTNHQALD